MHKGFFPRFLKARPKHLRRFPLVIFFPNEPMALILKMTMLSDSMIAPFSLLGLDKVTGRAIGNVHVAPSSGAFAGHADSEAGRKDPAAGSLHGLKIFCHDESTPLKSFKISF